MHAIIYEKNTNKIKHVIKDCVRKGKNFYGSNMKVSVNTNLFDVMWTEDTINPIMDGEKVTGWDKTVAEVTPSVDGVELSRLTYTEMVEALGFRKAVTDMTYQELDNYIETNITDLASAKTFIKTLAKVTLALCKIVDSK